MIQKNTGFYYDENDTFTKEDICNQLSNPSFNTILVIAKAFDTQFSVDEIHNLTKIDKWFLYKLQNIHNKKRCLEIMPFEMRFQESNIKKMY